MQNDDGVEKALENKQLLDEAENDIKNYPDRGQCYLPKPEAEADNIDQAESNNCFIIHSKQR